VEQAGYLGPATDPGAPVVVPAVRVGQVVQQPVMPEAVRVVQQPVVVPGAPVVAPAVRLEQVVQQPGPEAVRVAQQPVVVPAVQQRAGPEAVRVEQGVQHPVVPEAGQGVQVEQQRAGPAVRVEQVAQLRAGPEEAPVVPEEVREEQVEQQPAVPAEQQRARPQGAQAGPVVLAVPAVQVEQQPAGPQGARAGLEARPEPAVVPAHQLGRAGPREERPRDPRPRPVRAVGVDYHSGSDRLPSLALYLRLSRRPVVLA